MYRLRHVILFVAVFFLFSCQTKQNGTVEGTIVPPGTSARISAVQDGKTVQIVPVGAQDGKFNLQLAPGTYTITITTSASPYPLSLTNIVVTSGITTTLSPIVLMPSAGKAVLSGKIIPSRSRSEVKLIYEGKERAAVHTDTEGKYEFKELPAGTYILQANAPGHAEDATQIVIGENQQVEQNAVLFPISAIDGVDWTAGKIRATGTGLPPQNAANPSVQRAMAQRAALADAQRNLLRAIEQIRLDSDKIVKTAMNDKNFASKIQGFIKGYTVIGERELPGGKIEVVLELPLNGPSGLSRYITE
jgi:hypothetical protein